MRWSGRPASSSSRSSDSARCAPRLVATSAWISSTMTVSTGRQHRARPRGEQQEQRLRRRDQDVRRMAEHARALVGGRVARADARPWAGGRRRRAARPCARCPRAARAGCARRRRPAPAAARRRGCGSARPSAGTGANISRSIAARNAASVLPEPVGAKSSVERPAWISGQPSSCARVGAGKRLGEPRRRRRGGSGRPVGGT